MFGAQYCTAKRMPGNKKYGPQRFQDRWTQRDKKSQPFAKWALILRGPHSILERYLRVHLRVHLRESIKAAAELDGHNNLLTEKATRSILLGRAGIPARYALPYSELYMVHRNDIKLGRPESLPQARSAPLRGIPTDSLINTHGGQIVKVEGISNSISDVMVCDYDICATCNDSATPIPAMSRFENMPFLHLGRDCEPGIDTPQHFHTFHGTNGAEIAAPSNVPKQKQEIDVKVVVDGKEIIVAAVACVPESFTVCNELSIRQ